VSSGHGWCNVAAFPEAERAHAGAAMETCQIKRESDPSSELEQTLERAGLVDAKQ